MEVRDQPRRLGGGATRRWGIPLDHQRPQTYGAGKLAGVQGPADGREAIRAAQDGLRRGSDLPQGGESYSGIIVHVFFRALGRGVTGAGTSPSDGPDEGRPSPVLSRGSRLQLPDGAAADRGL